MTKQHTPGPWAISEQNDSDKSWKAEVYSTISDEGVARVGYFDTIRSEDLANARLIAAAPDLLAALESLLPYANGSESFAAEVAAARAAIAKARAQ
jgi:hypothetical protein